MVKNIVKKNIKY